MTTPLWLRAWHGLQGIAFLLLAGTGLAIHFGLGLEFRLALRLHDVTGVAFIALWLVFVVLNWRSGNARNYRVPRPLTAISAMARWYLYGMFRGAPRPFTRSERQRHNPLQGLSYLVVMYGLTPACALSGVALLLPSLAPERVGNFAGLWPMALTHLASGWALSLFLVLHLYMITTGPTVFAYLREIVTGRSA